MKKLTLTEIQKIAKERGGKCLSNKYINSRTKYTWQCSKGHTWDATHNSIQQGAWCPICGGTKKLTIEDIQKLAHSKGGKCLSNRYINSKTKYTWKCSKGHVWDAAHRSIRQGTWCPICHVLRKLYYEKKFNF